MSLRQRVLEYLRSRLADDPLPLRLIFWDGECFDFAAAPSVTITLHSSDLPRMLLRGNFARLGDAYVAGDLTVEGPIEDILRTGITLAERVGKSSTLNRLSRLGRLIPRRHSRRKDAADISYRSTFNPLDGSADGSARRQPTREVARGKEGDDESSANSRSAADWNRRPGSFSR